MASRLAGGDVSSNVSVPSASCQIGPALAADVNGRGRKVAAAIASASTRRADRSREPLTS